MRGKIAVSIAAALFVVLVFVLGGKEALTIMVYIAITTFVVLTLIDVKCDLRR